jgi:hypothetical protein
MLTITGASEEFIYHRNDANLFVFSDGTVLRVVFSDFGVWRITPVVRGSAELHIEQEIEDEGTDKATLTGDIRWVVHGRSITKA